MSNNQEKDNIIVLRDVSRDFHMGDVVVSVLQHIDLAILRGKISVIVGPSGSGKSTLLNLIGGIDLPTTGQVLVDGNDIAGYSKRERTLYRRDMVGFVFQFYNLVPTLTALENVLAATELVPSSMDPHQALEMVDLSQRAHHFPAQLSGGEQQRVAIARAIAKNPRILLCDEPTGALDLQTGRRILKVLDDLNQQLGVTVLIITHNLAIAEIGHRFIRLGSGTIAEDRVNAHRVAPTEVTW